MGHPQEGGINDEPLQKDRCLPTEGLGLLEVAGQRRLFLPG